MAIEKRAFGTLATGETVTVYRLTNESGAYAEVMDLGAGLTSLYMPDAEGNLRDVVLGYDEVEPYVSNPFFFGATVGRNGNRIANGRFVINGVEYQMQTNENENNLHSGPDFFHAKMWTVADSGEQENSITFHRTCPDGEQGFPGTFEISVTYTLTGDNALRIDYYGTCDKDTVANMTNHSYFNLNGAGSGSILNHKLQIAADVYTPVPDSKSIPTGELASVKGTPFDFLEEKVIGDEIDAEFDQLIYTGGYDHNFCTNDYSKGVVRKIAEAAGDESGIRMEVYSDLPAVQFYAGNFITDHTGKGGRTYSKRDGFCLETQCEPNSVNDPHFHSPILKAGEVYQTTTIYRFCK